MSVQEEDMAGCHKIVGPWDTTQSVPADHLLKH